MMQSLNQQKKKTSYLWCYGKEGPIITRHFLREEHTTSDVHAVIYSAQYFIMSENGKYYA
jgi:hypothetical protein